MHGISQWAIDQLMIGWNQVQFDQIIAQSILSKIFTTDTPYITGEGKI